MGIFPISIFHQEQPRDTEKDTSDWFSFILLIMQSYPNFLCKISRWYRAQGEGNAPEHWQGFEETALFYCLLDRRWLVSPALGSNSWPISFYNDRIMPDPIGPTSRHHFHLEWDLVTAFIRVVPNNLSYLASNDLWPQKKLGPAREAGTATVRPCSLKIKDKSSSLPPGHTFPVPNRMSSFQVMDRAGTPSCYPPEGILQFTFLG